MNNKEYFFRLLWRVIYPEADPWEREFDGAVLSHRSELVNLARSIIKERGGIPEDGVLIEDTVDTFRNGGSLAYRDGNLYVTFRADCEDDWEVTVDLPVDESELLP